MQRFDRGHLYAGTAWHASIDAASNDRNDGSMYARVAVDQQHGLAFSPDARKLRLVEEED